MTDLASASYRLKMKRAEQHLEELKQLIAPYEEIRPYAVTHAIEGKNQQLTYRSWAAIEPDPQIAIVAGDFLFNYRSALEHLRTALVPRKFRYDGYFPIFVQDIWKRDPKTGIHEKGTASARKAWEDSVRGMPKGAIRKIDQMQPFRMPKDEIEDQVLAILSRLNNADKHRELIAAVHFLVPERVVIHWPHGKETIRVDTSSVIEPFQNGAEILRPFDREVNVEASGSLRIGIGSTGRRSRYGLPETFEGMVEFFYMGIIPALEPFLWNQPTG